MDSKSDLIGVSVVEDVEAPGFVALQLRNWDLRENRVTWSDRPLFEVGQSIEIKMSYSGVPKTVFYGDITGLEPEFVRDQVPTLTVRGYDLRHRLMRGEKTRTFTQLKDSDIANQIASESSLTSKAQSTQIILEYVLQCNQTDLAFLQKRAQTIGYEVFIDRKTLLFRPSNHTSPKVLTLSYPDDLIEFYPRLSSLGQIERVEVRSWDEKAEKLLQEKSDVQVQRMGGQQNGAKVASQAFGKASQVIVAEPVATVAEAKQIAQAQFSTANLRYILGEGRCRGNPDIRAGTVIEITGVGTRFSGPYYVTSATHTYEAKDYVTTFLVRRNST
jgi:phage protein D